MHLDCKTLSYNEGKKDKDIRLHCRNTDAVYVRLQILYKFGSYDLFLKGNNVTKGIENYSEVVALLINLHAPKFR